MRILGLTVENFKRLSVVQLTPDGGVVLITGANEQGKTSVIDAIAVALDGLDSAPDVPIRRGQKKATIKTILGANGAPKLIVERRFTEKGSTLVVKSPEGLTYPSPQSVIDELKGALTFDPLNFMGMDRAQQFETLRKLVGVDVATYDSLRQEHYDARTKVNAELKAARAMVAGIAVPELPDAPPNREAILERLGKVDKHNAGVRAIVSEQNEMAAEIERHEKLNTDQRALIKRLQLEIVGIEASIAARQEIIDADLAVLNKSKATPLPAMMDAAAITAELNAAEALLRGFEAKARRDKYQAVADQLEVTGTEHTSAIKRADDAKAKAIADAKMPIDGLSFTDGVVLFNGLPLDQASGAQQLRVSAAIGAALNPKLRVMLARDASRLDSKSLALLAQFAEEKDFQIWCERVDESGAVGVVIEDGHVKGQEALVEAQAKLALEMEGAADGKK
jgi:AAA domain